MSTDYFADDPRSNRERMLAGDWYVSADPVNHARHRRAIRLAEDYYEAFVGQSHHADSILAELIAGLGAGVVIRPPLFVDYGDHLTIGARTFINCNLTALDVAQINIGADCQLGPSVQLLTPIHPLEAKPRLDKLEAGRPITLGDNVWLGGGVIVCPGVTIGSNTVVGAGSVVVRDLPDGVLAVGNPARIAREL